MRSLLSSLLWRSWELKRWQILDWNTRISHGPTLEAPFSSILDPKPASSLHGSLSYCRGKFQFREFQGWLLTKEHTWSTDHMECLLTKCVWDVEHGRMKRRRENDACLSFDEWLGCSAWPMHRLMARQASSLEGAVEAALPKLSMPEIAAAFRSAAQGSSSVTLLRAGWLADTVLAACDVASLKIISVGPFLPATECSLQKIYLYHICQNHQQSMIISYMQVSNYVKDT